MRRAIYLLIGFFLLGVSGTKGPNADIQSNPSVQLVPNPDKSVPKDNGNWLDYWEAPVEVQNLMPYYVSGYDEDGLPVYVIEYGKWDYVRMASLPESEQSVCWKYFEQVIGRIARDGDVDGKGDGVAMLIDWDGFTLANYASPGALQLSLKHFGTIVDVNKSVKYGFQVNTNFAAKAFLNIAKPFLGDVLERFDIQGTQSEKWKPRVLRKIPRSELPPQYGGSEDFIPLRLNRKWT